MILDARFCRMVGRPARDRSVCWGIQFVFPQITQIDADVLLHVNLRYLRHLRADLCGWVDRVSS